MAERRGLLRRPVTLAAIGVLVLLAAAAFVWRDDILRTGLDPKVPFQTYDPPPAPDYAQRSAWALMPTDPATWTDQEPPADVFFVAPTTYDGGRHWNAPIDHRRANRLFERTMAPNYAGPYVRVGRIFAPRYRQASLYTLLTLRDDAREARRFAYGDVARAFEVFLERYNQGRPILIVGVEQGGNLVDRLLRERVADDPALRSRLAGAWLIETVTPADDPPLPACRRPDQAGCVAAWVSAGRNDVERPQSLRDRSLVWSATGELVNLQGRLPLCFNPLLHQVSDASAPARLHDGAANATGLEWGARPPFLARQVAAECERGVLRVTRPRSSALKPTGSWADRRKVPGYNLFYADLEADAKARLAALKAPPQGGATVTPR